MITKPFLGLIFILAKLGT